MSFSSDGEWISAKKLAAQSICSAVVVDATGAIETRRQNRSHSPAVVLYFYDAIDAINLVVSAGR